MIGIYLKKPNFLKQTQQNFPSIIPMPIEYSPRLPHKETNFT